MKDFHLHISISIHEKGENIDKSVAILEIDELIENTTAIEAGKTMLRRIITLRDENIGRPFRFDALLEDDKGNLISMYADD